MLPEWFVSSGRVACRVNMATTHREDAGQSRHRLEGVKWLLVLLIVAAGVWGNAYFGNIALAYRVLVLAVMGIVAAAVAVQTRKGALFWNMLRDAKAEVRKVVWPTRQETTQTTMIVVVVVIVAGLVLWGIDSLLGWAVQSFIG